MQAEIIRTQEHTKGLLGGRNVKLTVEIAISLSDKEIELVNRYFDPLITPKILEEYASSDTLSAIKIVEPKSTIGIPLSKYKLVAYADDGFKALANMEHLVKAVIKMAQVKMAYVQGLGEWEGKQVISIE